MCMRSLSSCLLCTSLATPPPSRYYLKGRPVCTAPGHCWPLFHPFLLPMPHSAPVHLHVDPAGSPPLPLSSLAIYWAPLPTATPPPLIGPRGRPCVPAHHLAVQLCPRPHRRLLPGRPSVHRRAAPGAGEAGRSTAQRATARHGKGRAPPCGCPCRVSHPFPACICVFAKMAP